MGIFNWLLDFFGGTQQSAPDVAHQRLKALAAHQERSRQGAVNSDQLPNGVGPFGLCPTNPIPTQNIFLTDSYLASLRTADGRRVDAKRTGSTSATEITSGMIDIFVLYCEGKEITTIYICPYHKRNSRSAPDGFRLA
jgi:hypothetical protein